MPINWYGDRVAARVRSAQRQFIRAVALQVEGQTKVNIAANNQVDTGFMLNSVYSVWSGASGDVAVTRYARAFASSDKVVRKALSKELRRKARKQWRVMAIAGRMMAPARLPADDMSAIVGVGASYALYQEERHSFLLAAIRTVANQLPNVQVVE